MAVISLGGVRCATCEICGNTFRLDDPVWVLKFIGFICIYCVEEKKD